MILGLLASFVYTTGMEILDRCREAKQCEVEVARVALRTQNVLAKLEDAQKHFVNQAGLDASMYELKGVLENVKALVTRCGVSRTKNSSKISALRRVNPNKKALMDAEQKLQGITQVLGLDMLGDIKRQLNRMENEESGRPAATHDRTALARMVRDEIERGMMAVVGNGFTVKDTIESHCARAGDARQRAPPSQNFGSMMMMLGRVRFEELEEDEETIGEGTFGTVLSGTYGTTSDRREVAIKKARDFRGSKEVIEAFRQEVEIQFAMRHPNIVEVLAFELGDRGHPPCLVMERMEESLYAMLGASIDVGGVRKVSIVRDVCEGMRFLHSRGILHRDLKSPNILLDEDMVAKISDFGLAKVNNEITTATGCGRGFYSKVGSDFWMAPEVSSNKKATLASDVFSLHVVMWEVLTHTRAGWGKPIGELLRIDPDAHLPFVDMDFSAAAESQLGNIAERCGYKEPSLRPKMAEICSVVSAVLDHLEEPEENSLEEIAPALRPQRQLQEPQRQPLAQEQRVQPGPQGQQKQGNGQPHEQQEEKQTQHSDEQGQKEEQKEEQKQVCQGEQRQKCQEQEEPDREDDGQQQEEEEQQHTEQEEKLQQQLRRPSLMKRVFQGAKKSRSSQDDNNQGTAGTATTVASSIGSNNISSSSSDTVSSAQNEQQQQRRLPSVMERVLHDSKEGRSFPADNNLGPLETTAVSTSSNVSSSEAKSARPTHSPQLSLDETWPVLTKATAQRFASMGSATTSQRSLVEASPTPSVSSSKRDDPPPVRPMKGDRVVLFKLKRLWALSSIASNSTARSEWVNSTGWGTRIDMNDWYGVCTTRHEDDEGERIEWVTQMMLPMNGLCGDLPEEVMTLKCLVNLDLKDNGLTGVISSSIGNLRSLQTLYLSGNRLTGMIPRELGDLVALTVLDLHDNPLQGDIPETLGKLPRLETLDLSDCNLSGCIPTEFEGLEALKVLSLVDNSLTGEIPVALANIHRLEEIHLSGNQLTGNILAASASWQALRVLDLSNNSLEGCIPPELAEFKHLTTLLLDRNCYVTGTIPAWIGGMTSLEQIDFSAMQLGGEIPKEVGHLTKLTNLSLGSCKLVGPIPEELGQLMALKNLALYDNKLTGLIPRAVLKIPTLSIVNLERNDFEGVIHQTKTGKQWTVRVTKGAIKSALPRGCNVRL